MHPTPRQHASHAACVGARVMPGVGPLRLVQFKMHVHLIIAILLVLVTACNLPKLTSEGIPTPEPSPTQEPITAPENTRIVLHRFLGGAWGGEYEITVHATGDVSFRGHIGMRDDSVESGKISRDEVAKLLAAARESDFFHLAEEYKPRVFGNDYARISLSITAGGEEKIVKWQESGSRDNMTKEEQRLANLAELIIDTAKAKTWIQKHCTLEGLPNNGMHPTRISVPLMQEFR